MIPTPYSPTFISSPLFTIRSSPISHTHTHTHSSPLHKNNPLSFYTPISPSFSSTITMTTTPSNSSLNPPSSNPLSIGFYGGGMMAGAILEGLLSKDIVPPKNICVCEIMKERREQLSKLGVSVTDDASKMLATSKVVIIALKPNIVPSAVVKITADENGTNDQLFISICAGVKLSALMSNNSQRKCVRVMPNLPCVVGEAASAYTLGPACTAEDEERVKFIMGSSGMVVKTAEGQLDAVTGLSGSGPAYVFMMIEAMTDAGVRNGLPRSVAQSLAVQTVYGAAKMMIEDPTAHPAQLRNRVESPGGTTIVASQVLEENGFRGAVMRAVDASAQRAGEMGGNK